FISKVQDKVLASKPTLNSGSLGKFYQFHWREIGHITESASKINMDDLKHLKIHSVGLFGIKEEVICQLQTLNCISKPIQDILSMVGDSKRIGTDVKSSNVEIALFFWSEIDSFTDIKRSNSSSLLFESVIGSLFDCLHKDIAKGMGGGIQVGMKKQQKNNVSCNVEKMQLFPIEKERKQESSNGSVISKRTLVIEGAQSTMVSRED
ncbi:hypothetical protein RFI_25826, partial [Reticulomyxa filosa]